MLIYAGEVDNVELFVGGLLEQPAPGSLLGELFSRIVCRQFASSRRDSQYYEHSGSPLDLVIAVL